MLEANKKVNEELVISLDDHANRLTTRRNLELKRRLEMEKTKVVIIEDEFFAAQHLKDLVESLNYEVVDVFDSGEEFISNSSWNFDVAIVDIFLSGKLTGLDVGQHLKSKSRPFIFLTANKDSVTLKRAASLLPVSYISKPFNQTDVEAALEIASSQLIKPIPVRGSRGVELLNPNDILYIKSDGAYIEITTLNRTIVQRKYLKDLINDLPNFFARCHRSYVVNTNHIEQRTSSELIVAGQAIPISNSFKEDFR